MPQEKKKNGFYKKAVTVEQVKGIEPSSQAWEARILPMNYTCTVQYDSIIFAKKQVKNKPFRF